MGDVIAIIIALIIIVILIMNSPKTGGKKNERTKLSHKIANPRMANRAYRTQRNGGKRPAGSRPRVCVPGSHDASREQKCKPGNDEKDSKRNEEMMES